MTCWKELASAYRLLHRQNIKMERGAAGHAQAETRVEGFVPSCFQSEILPADATHEKPKSSRNPRGKAISSFPAPAEP